MDGPQSTWRLRKAIRYRTFNLNVEGNVLRALRVRQTRLDPSWSARSSTVRPSVLPGMVCDRPSHSPISIARPIAPIPSSVRTTNRSDPCRGPHGRFLACPILAKTTAFPLRVLGRALLLPSHSSAFRHLPCALDAPRNRICAVVSSAVVYAAFVDILYLLATVPPAKHA